MPNNYIEYAYLDQYTTELIQNTMTHLHDKYSELYKWQTTEKPHITIAYGPEYINTESEIITYDDEKINKLLPRFLELKTDLSDKQIVYKGVSYFNNPNFWVIKAEFQSDYLNLLRTNLRNNNKILDQRAHEFEIRDGYEYRSDTYPWAHSTLIIIKKEVSEDEIQEIVKDAYIHLKLSEFVGISSISLISAVTNQIIKLW
jgi:2'-5' RNA ligase